MSTERKIELLRLVVESLESQLATRDARIAQLEKMAAENLLLLAAVQNRTRDAIAAAGGLDPVG